MPAKADSPSGNEERYTKIEGAWQDLASTSTFAKRTLAQFKTVVAQSTSARAEVARLQAELDSALVARDNADINTMKACDETVKGVVGDPDFGDDSALYEAMGYKRKSDYASGLTRKKKTPPTV